KLRQTGVFLNEFYLAYKSVAEAGYSVEIATPNGAVATVDHESVDEKYWKGLLTVREEAVSFVESSNAFNQPITLEKAMENMNAYTGVVILGGHALMVDLIVDETVPDLLLYIEEARKPTGLICHAPYLLLSIPKNENTYN